MQRQGEQGQNAADFEAARSEVSDRLEHETQTGRDALHDARDELTGKAGDHASEAGHVLLDKTEGAQHDISTNLKALGGALRAASEHLANADQRVASKFALDASDGLERLSSSLKDKPFQDVLGDVRSFGRQNSGALIAGSVLAGVALGRFLKSSPPAESAKTASKEGERKPPSDVAAFGRTGHEERFEPPHGLIDQDLEEANERDRG